MTLALLLSPLRSPACSPLLTSPCSVLSPPLLFPFSPLHTLCTLRPLRTPRTRVTDGKSICRLCRSQRRFTCSAFLTGTYTYMRLFDSAA